MYSVLPLISAFCLVRLAIKFQKTPAHIASAVFLLAYIINFTRILGRHSLVESPLEDIMWASVWGIALFAAAILPKWDRAAFITSVFLTVAVFNPVAMFRATSAANAALTSVNSSQLYYRGANEKTTRVDMSAPLAQHQSVLNMINTVIPKGETYFDLSNQTMLYALSGREKPVYINQSPLHLSGEYTQERFIDEIKNFHGACDFALTFDSGIGTALDEIVSPYRHYKVYEYLYKNFRPLCKSADSFALWVRKDRYNERKKAIPAVPVKFTLPIFRSALTDVNWTNGISNRNHNKFLIDASVAGMLTRAKTLYSTTGSANVTDVSADSRWIYITTDKDARVFDAGIIAAEIYDAIIPIGYDYLGAVHTTKLGQIPYIWGRYDNKKSWNNTVVREYDAGGALPVDVQQAAKYVMVTFDAPIDGNAWLTFQNAAGESISIFNFTLLAGANRYIVRVSTDWWWNSGNIASFAVNTDVDAALCGVKFLVGD